MNAKFKSRGVERREYRDENTSRRVVQLTSNDTLEGKCAYYDICPWSPDARYIAFSSAAPTDLVVSYEDGGRFSDRDQIRSCKTSNGQVCVIDAESFEITVFAEGVFYEAHTGAFPVWHPQRNTLCFRRTSDQIGITSKPTCTIFNWSLG